MSDTTATMLQDKLNSIERNVYDGIDFSQEVTTAYVLADELGERIDQLSAENAKLRDERERMYKANVEKNGEILRLLEENAKLRELCARMFKDFVNCDYALKKRAGRTFTAFTRYVLELQELGIEVDK